MVMLNRIALEVRLKEAFLNWLNSVGENQNERFTLDEINEENTVYLIDAEYAESPEGVQEWLEENFEYLFEMELESWCQDDTLWPEELDFELFQAYFDVVVNSAVYDLGIEPLEDDEADDEDAEED